MPDTSTFIAAVVTVAAVVLGAMLASWLWSHPIVIALVIALIAAFVWWRWKRNLV
ncbi:MAG: hypothetical protein ISS15_06935 [Alphaproteobacteria bacterium]|nr:hypothetical protein [Alphaproteobacteria bacterium]MBL7097373.1 hypothetical protein [Alphaproteobacteria bacterium]